MRDAALPVHLTVLAAIACAASDAGPLALSTAATLVVVEVAYAALVAAPSLRGGGVLLGLALAASAVPFAVAVETAAPARIPWPIAVLALVLGGAGLALALSRAPRRMLAATLALACLAALVVDSLALGAPPAALLLPTAPLLPEPVAFDDGASAQSDARDRALAASRPGALVRHELAREAGLSFASAVSAPWISVPLGALRGPTTDTLLVRVVGPAAPVRTLGRFRIVAAPELPDDARDLDAFDVVLLLEAIERRESTARALESFVRRGGLLAGPPAPSSFGPGLDRALGVSLPDENGPRGARALGAGHVARVERAAGLDALVDAGLAEPRYSTVFDRATAPPAGPTAPADAAGVSDSPRLPVPSLGVLAAFVVAVLVASGAGRGRAAAATVLLAALACGGLVLLAPEPPAATAQAFTLDLGGRLGRRIDALRVTAGARGTGVRVESTAGVRLLGFAVRRDDGGRGTAWLPPRAVGWIVEDSIGDADTSGLESTPAAPPWSIPLLRPGRAREGVRILSGVRAFSGRVPPGVAPPDTAAVLVIDPGRP